MSIFICHPCVALGPKGTEDEETCFSSIPVSIYSANFVSIFEINVSENPFFRFLLGFCVFEVLGVQHFQLLGCCFQEMS